MKPRFALLATGLALALTMTACGGSDASSGTTTLEVQSGLAVDSHLRKSLEEVSKKFEDKNPDIKINLVTAGDGYEKDMKVRLASGNVPDIWATHGWSKLRYSKFLTPLQDEVWAKNFNPALADAMKDDTGAFYALPFDTDIAGIAYNQDVLDKAGFNVADITTWDDFTAAARAIRANGTDPITISGKDSGPAGNLVDWIAPGAYDENALQELNDGTFDKAEYQKILNQVQSWAKEGFFNPDYSSATSSDMEKALAQGNAAFMFSQNRSITNALEYNPDAKLGFMPVPSFEAGGQYLIGGEMNAYGISKTSKHPEAAKKFLAFLAEPENLSALAKASGSAPGLTNSGTEIGALQGSYDQFVKPGKLPLAPYFDRVYLPNGMWNTLVTTTDSVITGQSTADAATNQVASDFASLYGQNK